jgi:arginase
MMGEFHLGIGSISAVAKYCREAGKRCVLWFDAHADFSTIRSLPPATFMACPWPYCVDIYGRRH